MVQLNLVALKKMLESGQRFRMVFFGDSITSTEWVHPNWREIFEYVVKEELTKLMGDWKAPSWGIRGINSGLDGSTSQDWLERLAEDVFSYQPQLVILMGTDNDHIFGITPQQQKENLEQILKKIITVVPYVVFVNDIASVNEDKNTKYEQYLQQTSRLFPMRNVQFIDMHCQYRQFPLQKFFTFVSEGNPEAGIKPGEIDFCHPNQLGNAYIAKVLLKEIFDIAFDPERYMQDTLAGKMYPRY